MPQNQDLPRAVRFGPFELDLVTGELRRSGLRLSLQDQPFRILALLVQRPGELVTRERLREALWPGDVFVDVEHGLNVGIAKLRRALGDVAEAPHYVETLERRGYRFMAAVEAIDARDLARTTSSAEVRSVDVTIGDDSVSLGEGVHMIGRDPHGAIWIDSTLVSRRHATITVSARDVVLTDLGSRNGTFVNGQRLDAPATLADGDEILVGPARLVVRTIAAPESTVSTDADAPDRC